MKIIIKDLKENINIKVRIPLFVSKIILRFLNFKELKTIKPYFTDFYKIIKKHVKENGHFVLVDVETSVAMVKIII